MKHLLHLLMTNGKVQRVVLTVALVALLLEALVLIGYVNYCVPCCFYWDGGGVCLEAGSPDNVEPVAPPSDPSRVRQVTNGQRC